MEKTTGDEKQTGLSKKTYLFVVFGFGAAAFLVRWVGLTIPVVGTTANIDPREIFVILGAAFTGPVGGLVIGFLSGLSPGVDVYRALSTTMAHVVSGLLIGFLYKPVSKRWRMPALLFGWAVLVAAYYYIFLIPTFLAVTSLADPASLSAVFGADLSFLEAYIILAPAAVPEAVATFIVTAIILIALPENYRRPLW